MRRIALGLAVSVAAGGLISLRYAPEHEDLAGALSANAHRFLSLTGAAPTSSAVVDRAELAEESSAAPGDYAGSVATPNYMPNGWRVRPAGKQVRVLNFPLGLAVSPDGKTALVTSGNGGMQGLTAINASSLKPAIAPAANLFMGLAVTATGKIFASGGNADRLFRYQLAGGIPVTLDATEAAAVPLHHARDGIAAQSGLPVDALPVLDGVRVSGYPGNAIASGNHVFVAGTLSEPTGTGGDACPDKELACARVSIVDATTDKLVGRAPVGRDAYALALDAARHRLYVSNWGDEAGRGKGAGTVSTVDVTNPASPREIFSTKVGHQPSAVQLSPDGKRLFVANTNDDTLSVLDVSATPTVIATESVRPNSGLPVGAHPDALAMSPNGDTLFVALAGMNAIEVLDGHTGARRGAHPEYIPTGWYPSALMVTGTSDHFRLWVANAKGIGAGTDKGTGYNLSVGQDLRIQTGTVSVIDLPTTSRGAADWTARVRANDRLDAATVDACAPAGAVAVSEVLCPPKGKESPVRHVLYIVTENKTFDQYFGDLAGKDYDADPAYLLYGNVVTPNHHAIADAYSLSDRFFSDAQVSVTGHSWTSGAIATDHNEKVWPADYDQGIRGSHGNGDALRPGVEGAPGGEIGETEDELNDPEGGYIFEAFKRAGAVSPDKAEPGRLSMAIYGESTARESGDMNAYKATTWKAGDIQYFDTCRAAQFITGTSPNGPGPDSPDQVADCGGRTLPAAFNLAHWTDVFKRTGKDVMPNFLYMSLPVNHTLGTNLGSPTPASMVADNDYAVGLITEALSKSPFWKSTLIMQTEDDTQAAGDHVSPLRDYLSVSGPWAADGANHQWGSMPSLLRTIEQIFGIKPISLLDRLALPQHGALRRKLSDGPNVAPYKAIRPLVPFALNQPGAPMQAASMAMDWSTYDRIDEQTLNAILYAVARAAP